MCSTDQMSVMDLRRCYNEGQVSVGFDKMISRMC